MNPWPQVRWWEQLLVLLALAGCALLWSVGIGGGYWTAGVFVWVLVVGVAPMVLECLNQIRRPTGRGQLGATSVDWWQRSLIEIVAVFVVFAALLMIGAAFWAMPIAMVGAIVVGPVLMRWKRRAGRR